MAGNTCLRCGTCCRKGGPALHLSDAAVLEHIPVSSLVCLRRGELAFDPRSGGLQPLRRELLKIRGKDGGWECMYFEASDASCLAYAHRPLECRALSCLDTTGILRAMETSTLSREDIVPAGSALRSCIDEHERLFPVAEAVRMANERRGSGGIPDELDSLIRREIHFRDSFAEKVGVADEELWPYFGRPLWMVLVAMHGDFRRYDLKA